MNLHDRRLRVKSEIAFADSCLTVLLRLKPITMKTLIAKQLSVSVFVFLFVLFVHNCRGVSEEKDAKPAEDDWRQHAQELKEIQRIIGSKNLAYSHSPGKGPRGIYICIFDGRSNEVLNALFTHGRIRNITGLLLQVELNKDSCDIAKHMNRLSVVSFQKSQGKLPPCLVECFASLPDISSVTFNGIELQLSEARSLAKIEHLKTLQLLRCSLQKEHLAELGKCKSLCEIDLRENSICSDDVGLLADCSLLEYVQLEDTKCDDGVFVHLGKMPKLRIVYLHGTSVTKKAARKFEKSTEVEIAL